MIGGLLDKLRGRPSEADFVAALADAARAHGVSVDKYDAAARSVRFDNGAVINLHNLYPAYAQAPRRERAAYLKQLAGAMLGLGEAADLMGWDEARGSVLARVQSRTWCDSAMAAALGPPGEDLMPPANDEIAWRPLGEGVTDPVVVAMLDVGGAYQLVKPSDLEQWGVTLDEAIEVGRENLREAAAAEWKEVQPGLHIGSATGQPDLTASLLLLEDEVAARNVTGQPVACVPERQVILVTGDRDVRGMGAMTQFALHTLAGDETRHPVSGKLLRLESFRWEAWEPDKAPLPAISLRAYDALQTVNQQSEELTAYYTKHGADVAVPPLEAVPVPLPVPEELRAELPDDAEPPVLPALVGTLDLDRAGPTLVPRAQVFRLQRGGETVGHATRKDLLGHLGDTLVETDLVPDRWRLDGPLLAERLDGLTLHETPEAAALSLMGHAPD